MAESSARALNRWRQALFFLFSGRTLRSPRRRERRKRVARSPLVAGRRYERRARARARTRLRVRAAL